MNSYRCSDGSRVKESVLKVAIRKAKAEKLRQQHDEYGYNFCEECGISNGTYLDCSHEESVKSCKENGRAEKAADVNYITIRCRKCHQKKDKLNLVFTNDN